jgi:hypothetical protein
MPLITYDAATTTNDLGTGAQQIADVPGTSRNDADKHAGRFLGFNGTATPIVAGDTVAWDLATANFVVAKWVRQGPATADSPTIIGVAAEAIPVNDWGGIIRGGYVASVKANAAVAAGDLLQQEAVVGQVVTAGATTERGLGVALTAAVAGFCSAWLY